MLDNMSFGRQAYTLSSHTGFRGAEGLAGMHGAVAVGRQRVLHLYKASEVSRGWRGSPKPSRTLQ
jgi:hypothetical protein